jgi:hypothetical protein
MTADVTPDRGVSRGADLSQTLRETVAAHAVMVYELALADYASRGPGVGFSFDANVRAWLSDPDNWNWADLAHPGGTP